MKGFIKKYNVTLLILCLLIISLPAVIIAQEEGAISEDTLTLGEKVYKIRCLLCHGKDGDGKSPVSVILRQEKNGQIIKTYPRDLTMGVFRFRTTPTGCLPDDKDIQMIVDNGIPRSFMPPHKILPEEERKALVEYIKTFSERFEEEDPCEVIAIKKPEYVGNPKSIDKGKKIYKEMKCFECHGDTGKGDGPKSDDLKDDWGKKIWAFNFTSGELKRGSSPENVYITFTTGLDGSGMPSYEDSLNEEDRWHLVSYTLKLLKKIK